MPRRCVPWSPPTWPQLLAPPPLDPWLVAVRAAVAAAVVVVAAAAVVAPVVVHAADGDDLPLQSCWRPTSCVGSQRYSS